MNAPDPGADDTVRLVRPPPSAAKGSRIWLALVAIVAAGGVSAGAWVLLRPSSSPRSSVPAVVHPPPPIAATPPVAPRPAGPEFVIRTADEAAIRANVAPGVTVFRFALDTRILVLDFASLHEQGAMLNRVAALTEKAGQPHDRVMDAAALDGVIRAGGDTPDTYYYGHDYSAEELQKFFALADQEHAALDPEEEKLRRLLAQVDWLTPGVHGGLISIPAVGADPNVTPSARSAILHHELSHGYFFSEPGYAAFVLDFWNRVLTAEERNGVRKFLGGEGYDTSDEELMYNEMQAYLMFTRDPAFFSPERIGMTPQRLAELQAVFLREMPAGWLHDSLAADRSIISAAQPVH